jgi:glycosyltransferase involved in cell wall biosynthesis
MPLPDRKLQKSIRTAVIIPAYNAERALPRLLAELFDVCGKDDIILIDDGSTDATAQIARDAGVMALRQDRNRGKGAALKRGFIEAILRGYDAVVTLDADGQHPPCYIPQLLGAAANGGHDIVIASRKRAFHTMGVDRYLSNRITTVVVSLLANARIEDSQCGYRAINTELLRRLSLASDRFQMESELLIQAGRMGARIGHIDCEVRPGCGSHISHVADTLRFLAMCLRLLWV